MFSKVKQKHLLLKFRGQLKVDPFFPFSALANFEKQSKKIKEIRFTPLTLTL